MKKTEGVDVLVVGGSYGHRSLADSVIHWLSAQQIATQLHLPPSSKTSVYHLFNKWYQMIYRLFSSTYGFFFWLGETRAGYWLITTTFRVLTYGQLATVIRQSKPKVIVSTFFYFTPSLIELSTKLNIPVLNIISDPRSLHPIVAMNYPGKNLCFDQKNQHKLLSMYPQAESVVSGWFVRPEYEATYSQQNVRKKLGLGTSEFVVLITAGSEGTYQSIVTLMGFLVQHHVNCHVIVACGNSRSLYTFVSKLPSKGKPKIKALRFTSNLHEFMQAADVVVGKAGPNTIFESVATLTPFLATTYIEGQETGNLDLIKEYGIGEVELKSSAAARRIAEWAKKPELLKQYQPGLTKLRAHNQNAKKILIREVKKYL